MPVPMSVMEAAAQGNKKAMRLVEKEYGVDNGQDFAIEQLVEEFPPPKTLKKSDIEHYYERFNMPSGKFYYPEGVTYTETIDILEKDSPETTYLTQEGFDVMRKRMFLEELRKKQELEFLEEAKKKKEIEDRKELEEYFRSRGL
jgi:hypothetical protein